MKYLVLLLLVLTFACNNQSSDNQIAEEPTDNTNTTTYGAEVDTESSVDISTILSNLENRDSLFVTVQGEITSTCKMKGCWMKVSLPDGEDMHVTFKDYDFFVPKEGMEGKKAIFEGWVKKKVTDEESRRHYAKDAGQTEEQINSIVGEEEEIVFVANGVVIEE